MYGVGGGVVADNGRIVVPKVEASGSWVVAFSGEFVDVVEFEDSDGDRSLITVSSRAVKFVDGESTIDFCVDVEGNIFGMSTASLMSNGRFGMLRKKRAEDWATKH